MKFKIWLESKILAHISGASGAGKTTLAKKLSSAHPNIISKDLDDFDEEAENILKYSNIKKKDYTDDMLKKLFNKRQELLDKFIKSAKKPIILVGHHTEGKFVLHIPTENKFLLDTDAKTSAWRAYLRSQEEDPKSRRTLEELPDDENEAQETIDWLKKAGYEELSKEEIMKRISNE